MKAKQVQYDPERDAIKVGIAAADEDWVAICDRFENDVQRVRDVSDHSPYTALYVCFDPNNRPVHFLVQEQRKLNQLRHKVFYSKLGKDP